MMTSMIPSDPVKFSFYTRFRDDILAGRKTITIRDAQEASPLQVGQILEVYTNPEDEWFCRLQITSIEPVTLAQLNAEHARQENMSLSELQQVIRDIYPHEPQLFVLHFVQC